MIRDTITAMVVPPSEEGDRWPPEARKSLVESTLFTALFNEMIANDARPLQFTRVEYNDNDEVKNSKGEVVYTGPTASMHVRVELPNKPVLFGLGGYKHRAVKTKEDFNV